MFNAGYASLPGYVSSIFINHHFDMYLAKTERPRICDYLPMAQRVILPHPILGLKHGKAHEASIKGINNA